MLRRWRLPRLLTWFVLPLPLLPRQQPPSSPSRRRRFRLLILVVVRQTTLTRLCMSRTLLSTHLLTNPTPLRESCWKTRFTMPSASTTAIPLSPSLSPSRPSLT